MKTMNCKQLGGACDEVFRADSFDEMAQMSKKHCLIVRHIPHLYLDLT